MAAPAAPLDITGTATGLRMTSCRQVIRASGSRADARLSAGLHIPEKETRMTADSLQKQMTGSKGHLFQKGRHGFGSGFGSPEFSERMPMLKHFLVPAAMLKGTSK